MKPQDKLRYPIGRFEYGRSYSIDEIKKNIKTIAQLPKELKKALKKLKGGQLDVPYRSGGWTPRQVTHHLADSHMNAFIRMKLAVTERAPIIKPYEEAEWAETEDGKYAPVKLSLRLLTALHRRWVMFLESLSEEALERGYFHPQQKRLIPLPEAIALYAWHSKHHVAHIRLVVKGKTSEEETTDSTAKEADASPAPRARRTRTATPRPAVAATARKKPGPKPKAAAAASAAAPKRTRRSKAEMEAFRAQQAAKKASGERKKPGPKPKEKAVATAGAKPRRGMSPEHMAKIREARMAKLAAAQPAATATTERKKPGRKPKTAAATSAAAPKRTRRTKAEMEASRAQQAANKASGERKKPGPKPKTTVAEKTAAEAGKPGRKPRTAAAKADAPAKRRGMSPEHMARIREARMAKLAATRESQQTAAAAPKRTRRTKAEMTAASTTAKPASGNKPGRKPKAGVAKKEAGTQPKRRGMSPEHMAKIRGMRGKKKE